MLPHKRCEYALCRAYYPPETKRSKYCSDNCRTRASLRRQGKAYTDSPISDQDSLLGMVPLRKRALWKLHFQNPALLEKIIADKKELYQLKDQFDGKQLAQKQAMQAIEGPLSAYLKVLGSNPKKENPFAEKLSEIKDGLAGHPDWANQGLSQVMAFCSGHIGADLDNRHQAAEETKRQRLQQLTDEIKPFFEKAMASWQQQKELNKAFTEKHAALQQIITILNKTEPVKRIKQKSASLLEESCSKISTAEKTPSVKQEVPQAFKNAKDLLSGHKEARLELGEPLGCFLGKLERKNLSVTITGQPGQGKTHFTFALSKAFCRLQLKVLYVSLEEGHSGSFRDKMLHYGLDKEPDYFFSVDAISIEQLHGAASRFDVIILDSWTMMKEKNETFIHFPSQHPSLIFIAIFQQTTSGDIRGGSQPIYDSSINLEIKKGVVYNTKNRYGGKGEYHIFNPQII